VRQSSQSLIRKLSTSEICRGLTEPEVDEIFDLTEELAVKSGDFVFKLGGAADALLVVVEGSVEVTIGENRLATLTEGAVLGEIAVLGGQPQRTASVRALVPTRLLRIPARAFRMLLDRDNVAALKVVRNLAQQMCARLISANEKFVDRAAKKPVEAAKTLIGRSTW
jgi:CRP-like cAMP-binding protein